jgi:hypothetical protein
MILRALTIGSLCGFVTVVGGCSKGSTASSDLLPGFDPQPLAANEKGLSVILPIVRGIESGSSHEICTWTDQILDSEVDVKSSQVFQSQTGHHVVLYYTTDYKPPGTQRECTDDDMSSFRFAVGAGEGHDVTAPGNLVFRLPKGAQLVANHHYLNATPNTIDAQSAFNLIYATPSPSNVPSGALVMSDSGMKLPVGPSQLNIHCSLTHDMSLWQLLPHMHAWGTHIKIDLTSGTTKQNLFDLDWDASYTFHPPLITKDPSAPFLLKTGDTVDVNCQWNNTTSGPMTFGMEMCVMFGQTVDTDQLGNLACDAGDWGTF